MVDRTAHIGQCTGAAATGTRVTEGTVDESGERFINGAVRIDAIWKESDTWNELASAHLLNTETHRWNDFGEGERVALVFRGHHEHLNAELGTRECSHGAVNGKGCDARRVEGKEEKEEEKRGGGRRHFRRSGHEVVEISVMELRWCLQER